MHAAVLRYFKAVADAGSIRRASERLSVSASAINRQILKLEGHLGTPLFERRPDGMRLTESGRLVLDHFRTTLQEFARLKSEIDDRHGIVSGTVTILTLDSLTVHFLPEALSPFIADHPAVEVRVISGDPVETTQAIIQGNADLGLTFQSPLRRGISVLGEIPCAMHAIMSPDHPLAGRSSVTLEVCGDYPLIYQESSSSMGAFLGDEMEAFKRAHQPVLTSNTLALMKRLLLRGAGIAFYTRLGFVEELAAGRLVAVPLDDERLSRVRLSLIISSERSPTVAVRAMSEHLGAALARFAAGFETRAAAA